MIEAELLIPASLMATTYMPSACADCAHVVGFYYLNSLSGLSLILMKGSLYVWYEPPPLGI